MKKIFVFALFFGVIMLLAAQVVLAAQPGTLKWKFETGSEVTSNPTVAGNTVYVGSEDGYLYAVDADSGSLKWKFKTGSEIQSSPAVSGDTVYVGSEDGNLYAIYK
jgi:outer membrane protein assembly factor BamB